MPDDARRTTRVIRRWVTFRRMKAITTISAMEIRPATTGAQVAGRKEFTMPQITSLSPLPPLHALVNPRVI
ncbi:hypothetical protein Plo01_52460 [Planobispora longispora]|uniref:Uncharacterized protein n=1 Tax=Planobispora longispora TaxID=28887 RepID=A0A8J3RNB6_9ACTN|nr:hypothetical protein Plo01_52460 [Planobispora longispora]